MLSESDPPEQSPFPATVGVLGGGRMGTGIAHAFLVKGASVRLLESSEEAVNAARSRIERSVRASSERGELAGPAESTLHRLDLTANVETMPGLGLVIEAVPEDFRLKAKLLAQVEQWQPPDAVLATNTSSLSIDELSAVLLRPERFIGLHFFNPVPVSELIEVVVAKSTAAEVVDLARSWVHALGKTSVVVRDSPGFATSRLGLLLGLEAIRMVEEGVASAEDIDTAMQLGYKHPVGPLRLSDIVGLDVRLSIADYLEQRLGPRFAPPDLLRDMVARGELGRKSKQGFYTW